jgi:hypothetical protein
MDVITPWFMDCIIAVMGGQKLYNDEAIVRSQYALSWMRRAIVLSVGILSLSGKSKLMEQNACGTNFQFSIFLPIHPCFFLVVIMDRNAVCFDILE